MGLTAYIAAALLVVSAAVIREILIRRAERMKTLEEDELLKRLRVELKRADRFQYQVALAALDFRGSLSIKSVTKLIEEVIPDRVLQQEMREYDHILRLDPHLLYLVIPYSSDIDIESVLTTRLDKIAAEKKWKEYRIAVAVYPEDGGDAEEVREVCVQKLDEAEVK